MRTRPIIAALIMGTGCVLTLVAIKSSVVPIPAAHAQSTAVPSCKIVVVKGDPEGFAGLVSDKLSGGYEIKGFSTAFVPEVSRQEIGKLFTFAMMCKKQ